ncbi:MAG: substrate-binding domain-containing protein [Anaerolineae bacterium]|nr:substrate-binding domain-containing protein [Anaerolineae bacterium]MDW8299185.1 substrate-binding domain-containing protein [Anaerolineae bacterium]
MRKVTALLLILALVVVAFAQPTLAQEKRVRLGALIKNLDNEFFLTMQKGYEFAAARLGIDIVVGSTPTEGTAEQQLAILEGWLNEGGFDGFIVTPFRATSLNSALERATQLGIPIINIDELIPADAQQGIKLAAQIASNNVRAGEEAGRYVIANVEAGAEVAVIEGAPGTTSSIDRVTGFTKTVSAAGYKVVASQPANWDRARAFEVASNILQGNPNVKAIFAANDGMGLGAIEAVEAAGLSGKVIVLSVDAIPEALEAVKAGRLAGTVAQYPDEMAILAVEAMLKVLQGRPIAPFIESPVKLITKENVDTAGSRLGDPKLPKLRIGALVKNLDNEFFLTMIKGYEKAAADLGLDVVIGSTPTEGTAEQQLAILEGWLNEGGFKGFSVTPFRATSLNSALERATQQGIPIVNIDELIPADAQQGIKLATQIASNNVRAGQEAARYVIANVEAGAEVAVIEGAPGTTSSIDRVTGFTQTVSAAGYKVVASQPANWDRARAFEVASNILQGNPNVKAIFAANDGMGLGAIEAVEAAGLSGKVIVLSVDAIPEALEAVKAGRLAGTVAQYPDEMAYLAIEALIKAIEGRPLAPFIESPVKLITKENLPQ